MLESFSDKDEGDKKISTQNIMRNEMLKAKRERARKFPTFLPHNRQAAKLFPSSDMWTVKLSRTNSSFASVNTRLRLFLNILHLILNYDKDLK